MISVSYTHLDVYKRPSTLFARSTTPSPSASYVREPTNSVIRTSSSPPVMTAVSYTHLITGGTLRAQPEEVRAVCLLPLEEAQRRLT